MNELHPRAAELLERLSLAPHPEGGFYREIFRSKACVTPADGRGSRPALTTIYFLLVEGTHSRWHRVASDEVWHLYEGGPLEVLEMDDAAESILIHTLAPVGEGSEPTCTIAANRWQAARPTGPYALVGCTVGPGFDFADFQMLADDASLAVAIRSRLPAATLLI